MLIYFPYLVMLLVAYIVAQIIDAKKTNPGSNNGLLLLIFMSSMGLLVMLGNIYHKLGEIISKMPQ